MKKLLIYPIVFILIVALIPLSGCAGFGESSPNKSDPSAYSLHLLKNMEYSLPGFGPVKLVDGVYQEKPSEDSSAFTANLRLRRKLIRFGDVLAPGSGGAAVILTDELGGSGTFYYLAIVAPYNDQPHNIDTAFLGDRLKIDSISIVGRRILVYTLEHAPDDPRCCPTVRLRREYKMVNGKLKWSNAT